MRFNHRHVNFQGLSFSPAKKCNIYQCTTNLLLLCWPTGLVGLDCTRPEISGCSRKCIVSDCKLFDNLIKFLTNTFCYTSILCLITCFKDNFYLCPMTLLISFKKHIRAPFLLYSIKCGIWNCILAQWEHTN